MSEWWRRFDAVSAVLKMNIATRRGKGIDPKTANAIARPDEWEQLRKLKDFPTMDLGKMR